MAQELEQKINVIQILRSRGYLRDHTLLLSCIIRKKQYEYYERLREISYSDNLEKWLRFFTVAITDAARLTMKLATKIKDIYATDLEKACRAARRADRHARAKDALDALYKNGVVSIQHIAAATSLSFTNASTLLQDMQKAKIVDEITGESRGKLFALKTLPQMLDSDVEL